MWNTLRTFVNRTGLTFNEAKTSIVFAEDMNGITENLELLKEATDTLIEATDKVPAGGTAGQVLAKIDETDFNTQFIDPPAGGGGGASSYDAIVGPDEGDDYTDLKTALDAGARYIYLKAGTYTFSATYTFPSNTHIVGEDRQTTKVSNSALTGFKLSNFTILKNLTFYSEYDGTGANLFYDISSSPVYCYIYNCIFTDQYGISGRLNNLFYHNLGEESVVEKCYFYCEKGNPSSNNFRSNGSGKLTFINNDMKCISSSVGLNYMYQSSSTYLIFRNNKMLMHGNQKGMYVSGDWINITDNHFLEYSGSYVTKLEMYGTGICKGNHFNFAPNSYPCILLSGSYTLITDNRFASNSTGTQAYINVTGSYNLITNNIAKVSTGVAIIDSGTDNVINNNVRM